MRQTLVIRVTGRERLAEKLRALRAKQARETAKLASQPRQSLPLAS